MNGLKAGDVMGIIIAILIFGLIVIFHEFGHFLLARMNGIRVNEFSIGMGPKLCGFKRGETEFTIRLLPFGGACMMAGEDEDVTDEGTFNSKSVWARISVVLAGPVFNFILAFFFAIFVLWRAGITTTELTMVTDNSPAQEAGLQVGDVITQIDGEHVAIFNEIRMHMMLASQDSYEITYERDGEKHTVNVGTMTEDGQQMVGIGTSARKASVGELFKYSYYEVRYNIKLVVKSLKMLVTGKLGRKDVAGPVGMVSAIGQTYDSAKDYGVMSVVLTMCNLVIILSANLGVMNLLPIPALDGGRLLFLIIEAIRRKPLNRNREGLVNFVGFALLMVLMVVIMFNDIVNLIH